MLTLSPERINQNAPYRLVLSDSDVLRFITDHGLVYEGVTGRVERRNLTSTLSRNRA